MMMMRMMMIMVIMTLTDVLALSTFLLGRLSLNPHNFYQSWFGLLWSWV